MQEGASAGLLGLLPLYCISLQLDCFEMLFAKLAVACGRGYIGTCCAEEEGLPERSTSEAGASG